MIDTPSAPSAAGPRLDQVYNVGWLGDTKPYAAPASVGVTIAPTPITDDDVPPVQQHIHTNGNWEAAMKEAENTK